MKINHIIQVLHMRIILSSSFMIFFLYMSFWKFSYCIKAQKVGQLRKAQSDRQRLEREVSDLEKKVDRMNTMGRQVGVILIL